MSSSISAQKAKATHDAAMTIIDKEARDRAAKTEHLRRLRLAAEAEGRIMVEPAKKTRAVKRKPQQAS
jgi:hypothetical protein